jgi:hypothetical protein
MERGCEENETVKMSAAREKVVAGNWKQQKQKKKIAMMTRRLL